MNTQRFFQGIYLSPTQLELVMPFSALAEIIDDPDPDPRKGRKKAEPRLIGPREASAIELRGVVQRAFFTPSGRANSKKKNVPSYRDYIAAFLEGAPGDLPEVVLWTPTPVAITRTPQNVELVAVAMPPDQPFIAIDGETQLAARFDLYHQGIGGAAPIVVRLHHGVSSEIAGLIFYDRNQLGVTVDAGEAFVRNTRDPITQLAIDLGALLPGLVSVQKPDPTAVKISVLLLAQAICWTAIGDVKEKKTRRATLEQREAARTHLTDRLPALRPWLETQPLARRPAVFIAATDRTVTLADLERFPWTAPKWGIMARDARRSVVQIFLAEFKGETLRFAQPNGADAAPA